MHSKLFSTAAFVAGAAFAAFAAMFGTDTRSAGASAPASAFVSALPTIGTGANSQLPIELDELGQVLTLDASAMTWTAQARQTTEEHP
jgi:hypothetical protein